MPTPAFRKWPRVVLLIAAFAPLISRGDDRPSSDDPLAYRQQRFARADGYLRYLDNNHNGQIDADEVRGSRSHYMEKILQRTGVAPNFPIPISQFRPGLLDYYRLSADQAPPPDGSSSSSSTPSSGYSGSSNASGGGSSSSGSSYSVSNKPADGGVPGFGEPSKLALPPGFGAGVSLASGSGGGSSSSYSSSWGTSASSNIDERLRQYAEGVVKQYDANKNGVLDRDEWRELRGDPQTIDANHDGAIRVDELANYYAQRYGRSSGSSGSSSGGSSYAQHGSGSGGSSDAGRSGSSWSSSRRSEENPTRKGYRFLTPSERLPKGLPDWFRDKDGNGDGQVSMGEFSRSWSDATAREFAAQDRNGDGLLTPAEVLALQPPSGSSGGGGDRHSSRERERDAERDRSRDRGSR